MVKSGSGRLLQKKGGSGQVPRVGRGQKIVTTVLQINNSVFSKTESRSTLIEYTYFLIGKTSKGIADPGVQFSIEETSHGVADPLKHPVGRGSNL